MWWVTCSRYRGRQSMGVSYDWFTSNRGPYSLLLVSRGRWREGKLHLHLHTYILYIYPFLCRTKALKMGLLWLVSFDRPLQQIQKPWIALIQKNGSKSNDCCRLRFIFMVLALPFLLVPMHPFCNREEGAIFIHLWQDGTSHYYSLTLPSDFSGVSSLAPFSPLSPLPCTTTLL